MEKVYSQMVCGGGSGFDALLGGCRTANGHYRAIGMRADFWSSSEAKGLEARGPWHYIVDRSRPKNSEFSYRITTAYLIA